MLVQKTVISPKPIFSFGWLELWKYRELLYFFSWKEIKIRYKQAALGVIWTLIQPLAMMALFILVLSQGMGIQTGGIPAPLYYLSALLIWNLFNHTVTSAAQSMITNSQIIKKVYFPRLLIPISAAITSSFDFFVGLVIYFMVVGYYDFHQEIHVQWFYLIVCILLAYFVCVLTAFSLGTFLCAINVKYRDVRYMLPFLIQALFFITPVIYTVSKIDSAWARTILSLNPLHFSIELIRQNIDVAQGVYIPEMSWIFGLVVLYLVAIYTFRKMELYFADIV